MKACVCDYPELHKTRAFSYYHTISTTITITTTTATTTTATATPVLGNQLHRQPVTPATQARQPVTQATSYTGNR